MLNLHIVQKSDTERTTLVSPEGAGQIQHSKGSGLKTGENKSILVTTHHSSGWLWSI
jgi:hypothetical protein